MLVKDIQKRAEQKTCSQCGRYLNDMYTKELCPVCIEMNLFSEVKEYIRENEVKEIDVAEHFGISVSKVKAWIREGRIQYKGEGGKAISGVHCQICGKPIEFGTFCSECHHMQGLQVVAKRYKEEKSVMHFLGKSQQEK